MNNNQKQKTEQVVKDLVEKMKEQEAIIKSGEYMEWLYKFIKIHNGFSDIQWLYNKEGIACDDYEKVIKLSEFFSGIDRYCTKNLIRAEEDEGGIFYNIKYKESYIAVGIVVGQGAVCFAQRMDKVPKKYILYENIMNDVIDKAYAKKMEKLEKLKLLTKELKSIGIDYQVAKDTVKRVYTHSSKSSK